MVGLNAVGYDIKRESPHMVLNAPQGFAVALQLLKRTKGGRAALVGDCLLDLGDILRASDVTWQESLRLPRALAPRAQQGPE